MALSQPVDEKIQALVCTKKESKKVLATMGFVPDEKAKPDRTVSTLFGVWRLKLALVRAMLQKADILLLGEPTLVYTFIYVQKFE